MGTSGYEIVKKQIKPEDQGQLESRWRAEPQEQRKTNLDKKTSDDDTMTCEFGRRKHIPHRTSNL